MGVVSLKEINGELGRAKLVKYSHLSVRKYLKREKSLIRMDCVESV